PEQQELDQQDAGDFPDQGARGHERTTWVHARYPLGYEWSLFLILAISLHKVWVMRLGVAAQT
ncbi:hypothetical protein, partial [Metapseudomonas otitidis]|uniref:hypothetical protein n=1 Tax=Metapseudomonas otitidis TaxID=319939 RepID=UPI00197E57D0